MLKIIADDKIPFLKGALEPYAEVVYLPGKEITHDVLSDADAMLIRTRTKCDEQLLRDINVRFIGTATIGYDHIDTHYCDNNGIRWTNAPGCNSSSVQQYIAAALLTVASDFNFSLKNKTLGIIGVGNVGSKVAKLGKILGMNVLLNDPPRARVEGEKEFVNIDIILREADIVTVHVPLTVSGVDRTYHLFADNFFEKMKEGSWFFNSSRGEVTDTVALKKVLESSKLVGAVIDVWENEPDIDPELLSGVFLTTPHIAGYSSDGKANGTAMVVDSLCGFFQLPLENWYPDNVPKPDFPEIVIDGTGKTEEDIIREAVLHTYCIKKDDEKFRHSPSDFEKHRGDYPLRREFPSYFVNLANSSEDVRAALGKMGFKIIV
jgi:erythronate-4-phosphate dehydrogenase